MLKITRPGIAQNEPEPEIWDTSKTSPENRSGLAEETASFALAFKQELGPNHPVSPRISARQEMVSRK